MKAGSTIITYSLSFILCKSNTYVKFCYQGTIHSATIFDGFFSNHTVYKKLAISIGNLSDEVEGKSTIMDVGLLSCIACSGFFRSSITINYVCHIIFGINVTHYTGLLIIEI